MFDKWANQGHLYYEFTARYNVRDIFTIFHMLKYGCLFEANKHNTTEKKDFPTLNTDFKKAILQIPQYILLILLYNLLYRCFG